eukprot:TRINITY_DN38823_c0_g1_i5.p1 TRINITY_DN38823_c0_g1~~TRINITY_DN38823_c0_g1_i5.p1  ORF type:complete len:238 (-),score=22.61 TRINITY_DN38823_c0_g1_i5:240-899(-)
MVSNAPMHRLVAERLGTGRKRRRWSDGVAPTAALCCLVAYCYGSMSCSEAWLGAPTAAQPRQLSPEEGLGRRAAALLFLGAPAGAANAEVEKQKKSLEETRAALEAALRKDIWFISGNVRKEFFAENFRFQDPDVKVNGIDEYGKAVHSLFDQEKTTGEILEVTAEGAPGAQAIRVRWWLAATVGLPPTAPIRLATGSGAFRTTTLAGRCRSRRLFNLT